MPHKISQGGFVEAIVVIAGLIGISAFGIFQAIPKTKASASIISPTPTSTTPQISDTPTPSVIPTTVVDPLHLSEVLGVGIDKKMELIVNSQGEQKTISILGIEPVSASDAACLTDIEFTTINHNIKGKKLYVIDYDEKNLSSSKPQYVFLEDVTSLNSYLIRSGLAKASLFDHPYADDFLQDQTTAMVNKMGIWSSACEPTPTPSVSQVAIITQRISQTAMPTQKPIQTPTKMPTPTKKIQPTIGVQNTPITPSATPTISLTGYLSSSPSANIAEKSLNSDLILQLINIHRKTKNLSPLIKDSELCSLAQARAPELYNEIFGTGKLHEGFYKRNIPYWITENIASYPTEDAIVNWWLGDYIHRKAIEGDFKYSCGACSGNSCTQLFTSYVPK